MRKKPVGWSDRSQYRQGIGGISRIISKYASNYVQTQGRSDLATYIHI